MIKHPNIESTVVLLILLYGNDKEKIDLAISDVKNQHGEEFSEKISHLIFGHFGKQLNKIYSKLN